VLEVFAKIVRDVIDWFVCGVNYDVWELLLWELL
jgi:hypothetical protein